MPVYNRFSYTGIYLFRLAILYDSSICICFSGICCKNIFLIHGEVE